MKKMNELMAKQCNQLILEKIDLDLTQLRTYINSLTVVDLTFLSRSLHHFGVIFQQNSEFLFKLEIARLKEDDQMVKDLITILKKELAQPSRN